MTFFVKQRCPVVKSYFLCPEGSDSCHLKSRWSLRKPALFSDCKVGFILSHKLKLPWQPGIITSHPRYECLSWNPLFWRPNILLSSLCEGSTNKKGEEHGKQRQHRPGVPQACICMLALCKALGRLTPLCLISLPANRDENTSQEA